MFLNFLFLTSAVATIVGAVAVVLAKNIMHACVYLLVSLLGVAGLYVTLNADFVAATQLVVYVGGVVILMLFATMLTGGSSYQTQNKFGLKKIGMMGSTKTYFIGLFCSGLMAIVTGRLIYNLLVQRPKVVPGAFENTVDKIGVLLVSDHVLAFEISSVLLLGALVGAAMIARPRRDV